MNFNQLIKGAHFQQSIVFLICLFVCFPLSQLSADDLIDRIDEVIEDIDVRDYIEKFIDECLEEEIPTYKYIKVGGTIVNAFGEGLHDHIMSNYRQKMSDREIGAGTMKDHRRYLADAPRFALRAIEAGIASSLEKCIEIIEEDVLGWISNEVSDQILEGIASELAEELADIIDDDDLLEIIEEAIEENAHELVSEEIETVLNDIFFNNVAKHEFEEGAIELDVRDLLEKSGVDKYYAAKYSRNNAMKYLRLENVRDDVESKIHVLLKEERIETLKELDINAHKEYLRFNSAFDDILTLNERYEYLYDSSLFDALASEFTEADEELLQEINVAADKAWKALIDMKVSLTELYLELEVDVAVIQDFQTSLPD